VINTISQWSPLLVISVALYYRHLWDKGLKALFYLYLLAAIFEVINEIVGGLSIIYSFWTLIEVGFLLYIYHQWSNDLNCRAIFIIYGIVWIIIKLSGFESLRGDEIDTLSLVLASIVFIIIPTHVHDVKPYQGFFMKIMAVYYGGCLVLFLTINVFENKALAWQIHSFFNIFTAIGSTAIYFIRNNDIVLSNRFSIGGMFPPIRREQESR